LEIGGFRLQILHHLLEDLLDFTGANGGVAGIDRK
jgi:hypothetical protein